MTKVSWAEFKNIIVDNVLTVYESYENTLETVYRLKAYNGELSWCCSVTNVSPPTTEQLDYETNFQPTAKYG